MQMLDTPDPWSLLGRAALAILKRLRGSPQVTMGEGAIYQAVRVVALPGSQINGDIGALTTHETDFVRALARDVILLLQNVDGIVVEFSVGNNGEKLMRISNPSKFSPPNEDGIRLMAQEKAGHLETPTLMTVNPKLETPAAASRKKGPSIDPRAHASKMLSLVMEEPL